MKEILRMCSNFKVFMLDASEFGEIPAASQQFPDLIVYPSQIDVNSLHFVFTVLLCSRSICLYTKKDSHPVKDESLRFRGTTLIDARHPTYYP